MNNAIQNLTEIFKKFPGIGPKQAKRFVYFLLSQNSGSLDRLIKNINELKEKIAQCPECFRYFPREDRGDKICDLCSDKSRDKSQLMVIEKDVDLDNIKRSGNYKGRFFVLGGLLPILEKNPNDRIRINQLLEAIKTKPELKEIIIAVSSTTEGDNTADFLKEVLAPLTTEHNIKISTLGRGMSTGAELEYIDSDTIKNALENRH